MKDFFYILKTLYDSVFIKKLHAIFIFCLLATCFISIASEKKNAPDNEVTILKALNNEVNPSKDALLFSKIEFIPLETKSECLISDIICIQYREPFFFILDRRNKLFVFEKNGRFKAQIGSEGQGPQEYIKISSFFIDVAKQYVVITDDYKNVLLSYDFNGNFKQKTDMPSNLIRLVDKSTLLKNNRLIFNYGVFINELSYNNGNMAYRLIDTENMKVLDEKSYNPIRPTTHTMYPLSTHPITETDKGANFIMPICDTIFSCNNEKFIPEYVIEHKQKMVPKDKYILDEGPYESLAIKFEKNGYFSGFNGIYETDNHILLTYFCSYFNACFLANKKKQEGRYLLLGEMDENSKNMPLFREIFSCDKKSFVCAVNMYTAAHYKNVLKKNRNEGLKQFKNIIESLEEDDNPVLIIYTLNESY